MSADATAYFRISKPPLFQDQKSEKLVDENDPKMTELKGSCFLPRCIMKICRLRRIVLVAAILMTLIMGSQLLSSRSSLLIGDSSSDSMAGEMIAANGRKHAKDFPGFFLRSKLPAQNTSYCKFNYGLPKSLDWAEVEVLGTPQMGNKSRYRVIYNAIKATSFKKPHFKEQMTYATHVTPEFLYHIIEIARYWEGPIEVGAFVPDFDLDIVMRLLDHLCRCYEGMSKVSVHLLYPLNDKPRFLEAWPTDQNSTDFLKMDNETRSKNQSVSKTTNFLLEMQRLRNTRNLNLPLTDCSSPDLSGIRTFRSRHDLVYPVNVARNVARNASKTQYFMVSDVELIPSDGLATRFIKMIKKHRVVGHYGIIPKWRLAFVVPVFEVDAGEEIPRNKSSLQKLYTDGKAVYFHRWVCTHCQKIPELQSWLRRDPGPVIKPFTIVKRQFPYHRWEPVYISTKHTPWYSELLSWEGLQDKMTQMLEMCLKSYDFVILDGGFLCHSPGIKTKTKGKTWRYKHELKNSKQYELIVNSLAQRYPANPKCRLK